MIDLRGKKMNDSFIKSIEKWISEKEIKANIFLDGIVDEDSWHEQKLKPLFIMREVHDKGDYIGICNFLDDKNDVMCGTSQTWIKMIMLARGLFDSAEGNKEAKYQYEYCVQTRGKRWNENEAYRE